MSYSFLQQSIRDGSLVLWHDYRRWNHSFADLSGQGNDASTISNAWWGGGGVQFARDNGYIQVADSAELQLTAGTIVVLASFDNAERIGGQYSILVSKRDVAGINYAFEYDGANTRFNFRDSNNNLRTLVHDLCGDLSVAVSFSNGGTPQGYANGIALGAYSNTVTIATDDAQLDIGNRYLFNRSMLNPLLGVLIFNDILDASEVAQVHGELAALPGGEH